MSEDVTLEDDQKQQAPPTQRRWTVKMLLDECEGMNSPTQRVHFKDLLSLEQVAHITGKSEATIRDWIVKYRDLSLGVIFMGRQHVDARWLAAFLNAWTEQRHPTGSEIQREFEILTSS